MQHTDQLFIEKPEEVALSPEDVTLKRLAQSEMRLAALEKRNASLESSFKELVDLVRTSELAFTKKVMQAFGGVFHNLSDQLLAAAASEPTAEDYAAVEVPVGTGNSVVVKRTGDHLDFSTSHDPESVMNTGTEELAKFFLSSNLLADGETKWFQISLAEKDTTHGIPATEAGADPVSA